MDGVGDGIVAGREWVDGRGGRHLCLKGAFEGALAGVRMSTWWLRVLMEMVFRVVVLCDA